MELYSFSLLMQTGRFTLTGRVNRHINKYWCRNALVVHEVLLHDYKCWCLVCGECSQNQWAVLLEEMSNFYSVWWVLTSFCKEIRDEEMYSYFMQESAVAHTSNLLTTHTLWLPKAPIVYPCHYYVWGTVKYRVYIYLPQSSQNLKHNIQIFQIFQN